ncbi:MAG TPA: SMC-Scp complex subunit ScpB [Epulopiscium sp.]|nr:SMC-Scp complex subunit ScpB [Candidatus Epulonipiscium sp.]
MEQLEIRSTIETDRPEIKSIIESILFLSGEAVEITRLAETLEVENHDINEAVKQINETYIENNSGLFITQLDDSYQMCTVPANAPYIERFLQKPSKKILTQPIIETLAIVAYSQPITKVQIADIRGVRSDHTINKLIEFNLICEVGRLNVIGKPILFGTTGEFLRHFGFTSIDELPKVKEDLIERFKEEVQQEIDYYE